MEISKRERILEYINSKDYAKITVKQFAVIFGVKKENIKYIEKEINSLCKEGYIYLDDSKRVCKIDFNNYCVCKYVTKSHTFGFGIPVIPKEYAGVFDMEDIYISATNEIKDIFDEDIVVVKITKPKTSKLSAEGKIIDIVARASKPVMATIQLANGFAFAMCMTKGISDIYIPGYTLPKNIQDGDVVLVSIENYAVNGRKAEGRIVKVFSKEDMLSYDRNVLLAMHQVEDYFPKEVISDAKEALNISSETFMSEIKKREDRRGDNCHIYTIDDVTAKDLDDAIEIYKEQNDMYRLLVHIADVSYFVQENTHLDNEALKRGTSIYIPGYVVPMLPKEISNGVCSLNEHEDKFTITCDMQLDSKGNVVNSRIYKSIIRSKCRMNYADVEKVLQGDKEVYKEYREDILLMQKLAMILKDKREQAGSINFDIPESKVILNTDGTVKEIMPYKVGISNQIIEEFMLIANYTVAKTCVENAYPAMYRIHENPDEEDIQDLKEMLNVLGVNVKWPKKMHPKTLALAMSSETLDEKKKKVVSKLILRSLKLARYSNECTGHFGLNFKYYTHFTSPIRRYPDLFVHRILTKYIEHEMLEKNEYEKFANEANQYAKSCSESEKKATTIERDAVDMYMAKYMKEKIGEKYTGVISSVTNFGIYVKLENTVEGMIPLRTLKDYYVFDEKNMRLIGESTKKTFEIGDAIDVVVERADEMSRQIDFNIC